MNRQERRSKGIGWRAGVCVLALSWAGFAARADAVMIGDLVFCDVDRNGVFDPNASPPDYPLDGVGVHISCLSQFGHECFAATGLSGQPTPEDQTAFVSFCNGANRTWDPTLDLSGRYLFHPYPACGSNDAPWTCTVTLDPATFPADCASPSIPILGGPPIDGDSDGMLCTVATDGPFPEGQTLGNTYPGHCVLYPDAFPPADLTYSITVEDSPFYLENCIPYADFGLTPALCTSNQDCDDGDPCTDDVCDPVTGCSNPFNQAPCDDGDPCTAVDMCDGAGTCTGSGSTCGDGTIQGVCGEECDDGTANSDTTADACRTDCTLPFCGDGVIDSGEECDDGTANSDTTADACRTNCTNPVCGDGITDLAHGEECDDANDTPDDGCTTCSLDNTVCFEGEHPFVSAGAHRIVFEATNDPLGTNPDGNREIFLFDRKLFTKRVAKDGEDAALLASLSQLTDTTTSSQMKPTVNASARYVALVSDGDLLGDGSNADGNEEVFLLDRKSNSWTQVTDTVAPVVNDNPNLRAFRGKLLVFDSDGDLMADRCVGGRNALRPCSSNSDCGSGAACGNPELNREVFVYFRMIAQSPRRSRRRPALQQATAAPSGESLVGRSVNFFTRAAAISSSANLEDNNPDGSREVYRLVKNANHITPVSNSPVSTTESTDPTQARANKIAFASNANPTGENADGNQEIFLWSSLRKQVPVIKQVTHTQNCTNETPAIGAVGKLLTFVSDCNILGDSNSTPSVFIYDVARDGFLTDFSLRGPGDSPAATPLVSRRVQIITYATKVLDTPMICVFSARKEEFQGPVTTP